MKKLYTALVLCFVSIVAFATSAGSGTFTVTFTGDYIPTSDQKVFIAGNFDDTPSWERVYEMDKTGEATWTYLDLPYPADFQFKFVVQYLEESEVSEEKWYPENNIVFDDATFDYEINTGAKPTYYMAGNGSATNNWCCNLWWDANSCEMTDGSYSVTVPAGTYEFKVTDGTWDHCWGYANVDADNSTPGYENSDSNVKFTVVSEAEISVSFNGTSIVLTSTVPFGGVVIESWTVAGDSVLMGSHWNTTDTNNDMELVGGAYTLTKDSVALDNAIYEYKFVANHAWGIQEVPGTGNDSLVIDEAGYYRVTFTLDSLGTDGSATATYLGPLPSATYDTTMFVAGTFTNWAHGMLELPAEVNLPKDSTIQFKQVQRIITYVESVPTDTILNWGGQANEGGYMTRESSAWTLDGGFNVLLTTDTEGIYTFSLEGETFTVTWPELPSSVENLTAESASENSKFVKDGQIFIRRGNAIYNVLGAEVK